MYDLATSVLNQLPPETAHHLAIKLLGILPVKNLIKDIDLSSLNQKYLGYEFKHPLGLAAGFDKDAEVYHKLTKMGFSFVELGAVTPKAQAGNPRPRLFRLKEDEAIINRYGFNSKGLAYFTEHLQKYKRYSLIGINLGKNKETEDFSDFLLNAQSLINYADYFTINISSPNTPGLRDLQKPAALKPIIDGIHAIGLKNQRQIPLWVKLSPDLTQEQEEELVQFLVGEAIVGIIISNTTIKRENLKSHSHSKEVGGLSGQPLKNLSTNMIKRIYPITKNRLLLIGCGGIRSGQDAYEKLCAGANLLQIYTAFIFEGPMILPKILKELKALLQREGIKNISEIIGSGL